MTRFITLFVTYILFSFIVPFASVAAPLEVETKISKSDVTTGDFFIFQITIFHDSDTRVHPLDLTDHLKEGADLDRIQLKNNEDAIPTQEPSWWQPLAFWESGENKQSLTRWAWNVWPTEEGPLEIPAMAVVSIQKNDEGSPLHEGITDATHIQVKSPLVGSNGEPPSLIINQDIPPPTQPTPWLWIAVGAGTVLVLGLVAFFFWRKKKPVAEEIVEPAHERAFRRLKQLENHRASHPAEVHYYYFELSEIFREFIELRFEFPASSMTSQEFIPKLQLKTSFSHEDRQKISLLTQKSDLIKFAEALPTQEDMDQDHRYVTTLVEQFAYIPEETEEPKETEKTLKKEAS